jgi:dTDP-4-amino-4,6-dideoxygalactose transaminase
MVLANGLHPVFVDVDARTYNLDAGRLADAIGPRTRAIVPAHLFGLPCDMDEILAIARGRGLRVVEDSCETMFVSYRDRPVGSFGDVACFSTRAGHLVTTGIGGFACTSDDRIAGIMRSLVNDGRAEWVDEAPVHKRFVFDRLGFSYRASELEAALAVAQIEEREPMLASRARNAALLDRLLAPLGDELVQLPARPPDREHAFAMYPLVLGARAREKDEVLAHLVAHGIETRDLLPLLSQPTYRRLCGDDVHARFPVACRLDARGFYVGCHEGLGEREITHLATTLGRVVRAGASVAPSAA